MVLAPVLIALYVGLRYLLWHDVGDSPRDIAIVVSVGVVALIALVYFVYRLAKKREATNS
jgi:hypothetical protein